MNKQNFQAPALAPDTYPPDEDFISINNGNEAVKILRMSLKDIDIWFAERASVHSKIEGRKLFAKKFVKEVKLCEKFGHFIRSTVAAAQSRSKDYESTVKVENGHILQGSCSCAVGLGYSASCKHIAAMLYAVEFFSSSGELFLWQPPTSMRQTWHAPQPGRQAGYAKASELTKRQPIDVTVKVIPNFRNVIDKATNKNMSVAICYLGRKVNLSAMCHDHDYLSVNPVLNFVNLLNNVTIEDIQNIKDKTVGQTKSQLWWLVRKSRLSGSRAGQICKTVRLGKFSKSYATGIIIQKSFSCAATKWGVLNEEKAVRKYEKVTATKVSKIGFCIAPEANFFGSSPDAISEDGQLVLEVKCPYSIKDQMPTMAPYIKKNGIKNDHQYYFQCQSHMLVTGAKRCDLIIFTNKGLYIQNIKFSKTFCEKMINDLKLYFCKVFIHEYIKCNT